MRYRDIITTESVSPTDTWEDRFADHQRQQAKRTKLRRKLGDAESRAADQSRSAAAQRSRSAGRIADLKRDLAEPPAPKS